MNSWAMKERQIWDAVDSSSSRPFCSRKWSSLGLGQSNIEDAFEIHSCEQSQFKVLATKNGSASKVTRHPDLGHRI